MQLGPSTEGGRVGTSQVSPHSSRSRDVTETRAGGDLARRRPGHALRALAEDARAAAPVRTVLARLLGGAHPGAGLAAGSCRRSLCCRANRKRITRYPRWWCLHSVPVGRNDADIDHVVIGPDGVFTLNAKNHPGARIWVAGDTCMVNGARVTYVRNSRHEARRVGRILTAACGFPVAAMAVIAPVNAGDFAVKKSPEDVVVINPRRLRHWLRGRSESSTWRLSERYSSRRAGRQHGSAGSEDGLSRNLRRPPRRGIAPFGLGSDDSSHSSGVNPIRFRISP